MHYPHQPAAFCCLQADALAAATRADRAAEVDGTSGSTAHPRRAQRGRGLAAAVGASAPRTRAPAAEQPVQPELPAASGPVLSMHELAKAAEVGSCTTIYHLFHIPHGAITSTHDQVLRHAA